MENKILTVICVVLYVLNVLLAFDLIGGPKEQISRYMYPVYSDLTSMGDILKLNSDTVAITDDGEEVVLESGYEMCAVEYLDDGSIRIFDYDTYLAVFEDRTLTVNCADYEDVTEKVIARTEEMNKQVEEEYKHDLMVKRFWFIFPESGGSYLLGLQAALVVAVLDGFLGFLCVTRKKTMAYIAFIVANIIIVPIVIDLCYTGMCDPFIR